MTTRHFAAGMTWDNEWTATPPSDWDEIRSRLRSLYAAPAKPNRRASLDAVPRPAPPPLELLRGPQPTRVSWRVAERTPPVLLLAVGAFLQRTIAQLHVPNWWREHDPLTIQRTLLVISLLLAILVTLNVL